MEVALPTVSSGGAFGLPGCFLGELTLLVDLLFEIVDALLKFEGGLLVLLFQILKLLAHIVGVLSFGG